jgi:hypothetical protein
VLFPHLNERQRRLLTATEARLVGHGGVRAVAQAAGVSETTVRKGVFELEQAADPLPAGRVRAFAPVKIKRGEHASAEEIGRDDRDAQVVTTQPNANVAGLQVVPHVVVGPKHLDVRADLHWNVRHSVRGSYGRLVSCTTSAFVARSLSIHTPRRTGADTTDETPKGPCRGSKAGFRNLPVLTRTARFDGDPNARTRTTSTSWKHPIGAGGGAYSQREATLSYLVQYSLTTLAPVVALAALAGWIVAGRALRPVHRITAAAGRHPHTTCPPGSRCSHRPTRRTA